jgi:demethylmenaquinone methyltransferase/2-methoxy-6-polyprenyl-1,4-benzoquinol methylase
VDFTYEMLERAPRKLRRGDAPAVFAHGDALRLPLAAGVADVCTVAFGLRNVADRLAGLREMRRVVRSGGQVLVLEFTTPRSRVFGALYRGYFTRVLPRVGALVSRDRGAYEYLPRTVLAWPQAEELQAEMEELGLTGCGFRSFTGGVAALHWGRVP